MLLLDSSPALLDSAALDALTGSALAPFGAFADGPALAPVDAALDPQQLSADATARVARILTDELTENTRRTYRHALLLWWTWYGARYGAPLALPVPVPVVQQFLLDFTAHESVAADGTRVWANALPPAVDALLVRIGVKEKPGPWALNTVMTRVAALAAAHGWQGLPSPTVTTEILRLRRALRRHQANEGIQERRAKALVADEVRRMMAVCGEDLIGLRDGALLAFAFASGGRRRSEVAGALVEALERHPDGRYTFVLGRSKTNQTARLRPQDAKPIEGLAAAALTRWLETSGIGSGAIWRSVRGDRLGQALSGAAIYDIVVKRARQAGIPGAVMAHSLRAGFVTEALSLDLPIPKIMDKTGHTTLQSIRHYHRPERILASDPTARLLDQT